MYYVVAGYRDSFIYHAWFWQSGWWNAVFWLEALAAIGVGTFLFKKLRPYFADVL